MRALVLKLAPRAQVRNIPGPHISMYEPQRRFRVQREVVGVLGSCPDGRRSASFAGLPDASQGNAWRDSVNESLSVSHSPERGMERGLAYLAIGEITYCTIQCVYHLLSSRSQVARSAYAMTLGTAADRGFSLLFTVVHLFLTGNQARLGRMATLSRG